MESTEIIKPIENAVYWSLERCIQKNFVFFFRSYDKEGLI